MGEQPVTSVPIFDAKGNRVGTPVPMVVGNRYKVFIPAKKITKAGRLFHERIVEVIGVFKSWGKTSIRARTVEASPKQASYTITGFLHEDWLFTIDPAGNCICETQTLMVQGCRCGGN